MINNTYGLLAKRESIARRRAYVWATHIINFEFKRPKIKEQIIFLNEDLRGVKTPYNDIVVIALVIEKFKVQKIMVHSWECSGCLVL